MYANRFLWPKHSVFVFCFLQVKKKKKFYRPQYTCPPCAFCVYLFGGCRGSNMYLKLVLYIFCGSSETF